MLKIESKEFFPIAGDKDFKIKLKAPSYLDYQDILIERNKAIPSGGPDANKDSPAAEKAYIQKLFETAVVSVEGCIIHGITVTEHGQLAKLAPSNIIALIVEEIQKLAKPSEEEIKN